MIDKENTTFLLEYMKAGAKVLKQMEIEEDDEDGVDRNNILGKVNVRMIDRKIYNKKLKYQGGEFEVFMKECIKLLSRNQICFIACIRE